MRVFSSVLIVFLQIPPVFGGERIFVDAKLNDEPIRFVFDTGADQSIIWERTARKRGIEIHRRQSPRPGIRNNDRTEQCDLTTLRGDKVAIDWFYVLKVPDYAFLDFHGVLSWGNFRQNVFRLAPDGIKIVRASHDPFEGKKEQFDKWQLDPGSRLLVINTAKASDTPQRLLFDTGMPFCVTLSSQRWRAWIKEHGDEPHTLTAMYFPAVGTTVKKVYRAKDLKIGRFSIPDATVMEDPDGTFEEHIKHYQGRLGIYALLRFVSIIDGKDGFVYTRGMTDKGVGCEYNRLGAVFTAANPTSDDLVATVVAAGPAHKRGVRNGDRLRRVDDLDVTKWRSDPKVLPLSRFWKQPAGTKIQLTLERDGKMFDSTVVLEDILGR